MPEGLPFLRKYSRRFQALPLTVCFISPDTSLCAVQMVEEKLTAQKQQAYEMLLDVLVDCQRSESAFLSAILTACDGCRQEVRQPWRILDLSSFCQMTHLHSGRLQRRLLLGRHIMITFLLLAGEVHRRGGA